MNEKIKTTHCPYCKEIILEDAIKCKHCNHTLWLNDGGTCSYCNKDIKSGASKCIHCLSALLSLSLQITPSGTKQFQQTVSPTKKKMTYAKKEMYKVSGYQGVKEN